MGGGGGVEWLVGVWLVVINSPWHARRSPHEPSGQDLGVAVGKITGEEREGPICAICVSKSS